jgi:hypothetical protein
MSGSEAFLLVPGEGEFRCCANNHDFGGGPVECDKLKILPVVERLMIQEKIERLRTQNGNVWLRCFAVCEHTLFRGLGKHAMVRSNPKRQGRRIKSFEL